MLSGQIRDQAALYGLIAKVHDMELCPILVKHTAGESTKEWSDVELDRRDNETGTVQ